MLAYSVVITNRLQFQVPDDVANIERQTTEQVSNIHWFRMKKGRVTATMYKACCGKPHNDSLTVGNPAAKPCSIHAQYGLATEEKACEMFAIQIEAVHIRKCGIFVYAEHGQLAASPDRIGRVSLARENEAGGSWEQEVYILHVNIIYDFVLFLVVIIELFPNRVFKLYCPEDYYKQKHWNTLPLTMITEIMNFNRLL